MNTVELKQRRKAVKDERKSLADAVRERDLTPEEQAKFDDLSTQVDALTQRIAALEKIEDDEAGTEEEVASERSNSPKKDGHLEFNLSTSKSRGESREYSIQRALRLAASGQRIDGIEGETSQEIGRYRSAPQGFYMPTDFKLRGRHKIQRDLTTTTGTGAVGVRLEPTLIDLFRNRMVLEKLGVQIVTGLKGKFAYPRQNAASQFHWIGEGVNATPSNPTYDAVNFVPRTASCQVNMSRKFIFESSFDAETAVENDMAKVMAIGLDTSGLNGNPAVEAASPTGILQNGSVTNYTVAADTGNGGALSYADAIALESVLTSANANSDSLAYVSTPKVRGKLKATPKVSGGTPYPEFVWGVDNMVNGYTMETTNEMPGNLTKGTGTNLQSLIFGNWSDAMLALWSGVDVIVNPYSNDSSGAIRITMLQEADFQILQPASFVVATDISVA